MEEFTIIGEIADIELIAQGMSVRDRARLNRVYGYARWRKFTLPDLGGK